jgi:pyridoxal phosphate enzyme (YggS family)
MKDLPKLYSFMRDSLEKFYDDLARALSKAGRAPQDIKLVAVSKAQPLEAIQNFLRAQKPFWALGESYLDEMCEKQKHISATWHFIGRLQSRKIESLLKRASCLHAVGRIKELEAIARAPIPFFVQFNVSGETEKNGFHLEEATHVKELVEQLGLQKFFQGVMAMPAPIEKVGDSVVRKQMLKLRDLRDLHFAGSMLNMGTSSDFEMAIEEGSDVIRVGSLLFGERHYM